MVRRIVLREDLLYLAEHVLFFSIGRGASLCLQISEQATLIQLGGLSYIRHHDTGLSRCQDGPSSSSSSTSSST